MSMIVTISDVPLTASAERKIMKFKVNNAVE